MIIEYNKSLVMDVSSDATTITAGLPINGLVQQIQFVVPDLDDTDTAELKILNSFDNEVYASGEKAESSTHIINVQRPVTKTMSLKIEASDTQSADRTFTVVIYYEV